MPSSPFRQICSKCSSGMNFKCVITLFACAMLVTTGVSTGGERFFAQALAAETHDQRTAAKDTETRQLPSPAYDDKTSYDQIAEVQNTESAVSENENEIASPPAWERLRSAILDNDNEQVRELLADGVSFPTSTDLEGISYSPVGLALLTADRKTLTAVLESIGYQDQAIGTGLTVLTFAILMGREEFATDMAERGLPIVPLTKAGLSPKEIAKKLEYEELSKLLPATSIDLNALKRNPDIDGLVELLEHVCRTGDADDITDEEFEALRITLVSAEINVCEKSKTGIKPIQYRDICDTNREKEPDVRFKQIVELIKQEQNNLTWLERRVANPRSGTTC